MAELKALIEKLKDEKKKQQLKHVFLNEHDFHREAEYIQERIRIIQIIQYELERLTEGKRGIDSEFKF